MTGGTNEKIYSYADRYPMSNSCGNGYRGSRP